MSEWQPINTAPKDGTRILIGAFYDSGAWDVAIGEWRWSDRRQGFRPFVGQSGDATHWQPLPAPPLSP